MSCTFLVYLLRVLLLLYCRTAPATCAALHVADTLICLRLHTHTHPPSYQLKHFLYPVCGQCCAHKAFASTWRCTQRRVASSTGVTHSRKYAMKYYYDAIKYYYRTVLQSIIPVQLRTWPELRRDVETLWTTQQSRHPSLAHSTETPVSPTPWVHLPLSP